MVTKAFYSLLTVVCVAAALMYSVLFIVWLLLMSKVHVPNW